VDARDSADLPVPGAVTDGGRELSVLELLEEMRKERARQAHLIEEAEIRERIVLGEQWIQRGTHDDRSFASAYYDETRITENLTYPLVLTYSARVNQGRIDPRAAPLQPTRQDIAAAEAANMILDYEKQRTSEDELIAEAATLAQMHGDVLFMPQWDDGDGPHLVQRQRVDEIGPVYDIATGAPVMEEAWEWGGLVERVVAAPDYWTSGEDRYDEAQWVCVRHVINEHLARARLEEAGMIGASPKAQDYPTALDRSRRGVEAFELWHRPGARVPGGLVAVVVADRVVKASEYPRDERGRLLFGGELPGAQWKLGQIRGCPRGKTHVSDAIHQQRLVNTALRAILMRAEVAKSASLVGPTPIIAALGSARFNRVPNDDTSFDLRQRMGWFEGPDIPGGLMAVYDRARRALYDVFGVSEATSTGGDPSETKSGQQIRDATALDAQKIGPARRALEEARKIVARQKLQLWQHYVDNARLVRITGPDGLAAKWFRGADLAGGEIVLEIGSGIMSTRIAGQRYAEESAQAGYLSPQAAIERRETGLSGTVGDAEAGARIDSQARAALAGQPQQPIPDVDPNAALERISRHLAAAAMDGQDVSGLVQLAQSYRQAAQAAAQAQAQEQPNNGPGRLKPQPMGAQKGAVDATKFQVERARPEGTT
jgi:hypothetical protein